MWAQVPPRKVSSAAAKAFQHPDLFIPNRYRPAERVPPPAREDLLADLAALGAAPQHAFLDNRGGRWGTLILATPLLPGTGVGNRLTWADLALDPPVDRKALEKVAWNRLLGFLRAGRGELRIDPHELGPVRITVHEEGALIQIHAGRLLAGVPVRNSTFSAVLRQGNLILLGTRNWGTVSVSTRADLSVNGALAAVRAHLDPLVPAGFRRAPRLVIVPMAEGRDPDRVLIGKGYRHRLAWEIPLEVDGEPGTWEALVDAHSGELLAFTDRNRYESPRKVVGGVYPVTNDPGAPGGGEESGYPMPFTAVSHGQGELTSDGSGNLPICVEGPIATSLEGRYVSVIELCGPLSESSPGDLDLGSSGGTDCATPPGASPGNTHAARTGYYELNRIREVGRGHLPDNGWIESRVPLVTNFPPLLGCNAFWDGSGVIFFSSDPTLPPSGCSNTGELAGVVDHEWAHGLDDNDANGLISNPAEGIADVFAALRLNDSCIGRGFFQGTNCDPGDGDPCTACDGVRDVDWAKRLSGAPHDIAFIDSQCPAVFVGEPGPCGGPIHCEGALVSEAAWDLLYRDLAPISGQLDHLTFELVNRLFYLGSGMVGDWFQCTPGAGTGDGCNADGGYLNLLAVDDDDGDLGNGTPHMEALFAAFDRHGIGCGSPAIQNHGCAGAPSEAPMVTVTGVDRGAELTWNAVAGADKYAIFRGEGSLGCTLGKAKIGETTGTRFLDDELMNDFPYSYVVIPIGAHDSCLGPASECVAAIPETGPNAKLDATSAVLNVLDGDLDTSLDNCETAQLSFDLHNLGVGTLSNVRLLDVQVLSHPTSVAVTSPLPAMVTPSLGECAAAQASFQFRAEGLGFDDLLEFRISFTADELAQPRSGTLRVRGIEFDIESHASKTFSFESGLEGWQVVQGTFDLTATGGAQDTATYLASSANLAEQCDQIRSPLLRLSSTSTLSLWNLFDIEGPFVIDEFIFWSDRANVALFDPATGQRSTVSPDGGRLYNAGGSDGACITANQEGWADSMPTWAESNWSADVLSSAAGQPVHLDVGYATDPYIEGFGFWFDEVTITDLELLVQDGQPDVCTTGNTDPVAVDDIVTATVAGPVTIAALVNDSDPDAGDALRILSVTSPAQGSVTINAIGPDQDTITYSPDGCFVGVDGFDYQVTDGRGGIAAAGVTVDLTALASHLGDDLDLSGQVITSSEVFQGCNSISAGDGFEIGQAGGAVFRAGAVITLRNDFSVAAGGEFTAELATDIPQ